jgi:hypothetical protein
LITNKLNSDAFGSSGFSNKTNENNATCDYSSAETCI